VPFRVSARLILLCACVWTTPLSAQSPQLLVRQVDRAYSTGRGDSVHAALLRARRAGDSTAALGLAIWHRLRFDYDSADQLLQPLMRQPGDMGRTAQVEYAQSLLAQGKGQVADTLLAALAPAALSAGDRINATLAYGALGALRERRVSPRTADSLATLARAAAPDEWSASAPRCQRAYLAARMGNPAGEVMARGAGDSAQAAGNLRAHALCTMALAIDYERRGLDDSTLAVLQRVAGEHRAQRNWAGLAAVQQWAGYVEQQLGNLGGSRRRLNEAIHLATKYHQPSVLAWSHLNLGDIALRLADPPAAIAQADAAQAIDVQLGDRWGLALAERMRADAFYVGERFDEAERRYREAVRALDAAGNETATVHIFTRLAGLTRRRGALATADSLLAEGRARSVRLHVSGGLEMDLEAAQLQAAHGDLAGAARRLTGMLTENENPARRFDVQVRLAHVLAEQGKVDSAGRLLADADRRLGVFRATLTERDLRATWLQVRRLDWEGDAGAATVIAALASNGRVTQAFALAEQRRARVLFDELARRASLADATASSATPVASADSVRRALPDSTAMLFYVSGGAHEPLSAFVLTRDTILAQRLVSPDSLRSRVDRFAAFAASGTAPVALATALGAALLPEAIRTLPSGIVHVVIIPDGPLHRAPLELLPLADGRALLDHASVTLAPSAAVAVHGWRRPTAVAARMLVFGDPAAPSDSTLRALPGARAEARAVGRYARHADVRLGSDATEHAFKTADLRGLGVLHFATHALVSEHSPAHTGLVLGADGTDDGFVGVEELGARPIDATLVVLSACQTNDGAVVAGEGVQGVVAPLLESGVRAVVATRWNLPDAGGEHLVRRFYDGLADGLAAEVALQRAKLEARAAGVPLSVWGAYVLVGDGRVRVPLHRPTTPIGLWAAVVGVAALGGLGVLRVVRRPPGGPAARAAN
jgi:tetratricopeptide (TPR) repeat protein